MLFDYGQFDEVRLVKQFRIKETRDKQESVNPLLTYNAEFTLKVCFSVFNLSDVNVLCFSMSWWKTQLTTQCLRAIY